MEGIKLMGRRLLDLIETCMQNGVHLDYLMTFTHVTHRKWKQRLIEIHTQLKEWEQEHNGKLTFSKAFDSLVLKLKTKHTIV